MNNSTNKATLIKKELLPRNFKLTFKKQENTQSLILHEEQKELYNWLELNQEYFYTWKKGRNNNYQFINPQSIKKSTKETENSTEKLDRKHTKTTTPQQGFFIQELVKSLKLKFLTKEEFSAKIKRLKNKFERINQSDNLKFVFEWMEEFITTLYLKHEQLEKKKEHYNYTEQEQKERDFLTKIGTMFLEEWIYHQDKRESKYNQHYFLAYLKNKQEK